MNADGPISSDALRYSEGGTSRDALCGSEKTLHIVMCPQGSQCESLTMKGRDEMWMRLYTVCDAILYKLYLGASCALQIVLVGGRNSQNSKGPDVRKHGLRRSVMAKVIEFYIPKNFQSPNMWAPQLQLGKVIEFRSAAKKSA